MAPPVSSGGPLCRLWRVHVDARMAHDGPHAQIVLDSPLPAAGIRDVRLGITPIPDGMGITVEGLSRLGTFNGSMGLFSAMASPPGSRSSSCACGRPI
jgi:hypothetical protein